MTEKINNVYSALDELTAELDQQDTELQWPHECGQEISDRRTINVMQSMQPWARQHGLTNLR